VANHFLPDFSEIGIMHATRLLAEAVTVARHLGYQVREDLLDGAGGGHCLLGEKKLLLLDVTQSSDEQLSDVLDALRADPQLRRCSLSTCLSQQLAMTRAA
jgi:hypothetical protein